MYSVRNLYLRLHQKLMFYLCWENICLIASEKYFILRDLTFVRQIQHKITRWKRCGICLIASEPDLIQKWIPALKMIFIIVKWLKRTYAFFFSNKQIIVKWIFQCLGKEIQKYCIFNRIKAKSVSINSRNTWLLKTVKPVSLLYPSISGET